MKFPKKVQIVEVAPRDGLQNESQWVETENKIEFINRLSLTGIKIIEATSFVSAEKIPQTRDANEVLQAIIKHENVAYPVLVPNLQGFEAALAAGAEHIAVFTAASNSFTQKNIHCTIEESLTRFKPVFAAAKHHHIPVRAYISCCLGCPYEGDIPPTRVEELALQLLNMGAYEISLGDTIGVGTPLKAQAMVHAVSQSIAIEQLAAHFHDTYGQALANLFACLELGIQTIDSSVAGLGGCPYAPGAAGNVATEEVVYMLEGLDIQTGIDLTKLTKAGQYMCDLLQRPNRSRVSTALLSR